MRSTLADPAKGSRIWNVMLRTTRSGMMRKTSRDHGETNNNRENFDEVFIG
jgi:hypothetical protein